MAIRFDEGGDYNVNGIDFTAWDLKKGTSANVTYNIGEDDEPEGFDFEENGPFNLTIKDKNRTYDLSAVYKDEGPLLRDWSEKSESKKSHIAYTFADNTTVTGNKGINVLFSDTLGGAESTLTYESKGGKDLVVSNGSSDGTYAAKLTSKSNFYLADDGGEDLMYLNNTKKELGKARLFFNVNSDEIVPSEVPEGSELEDFAEITLFCGKLSKSSFVVDSDVIDDETVYDVNTKTGIVCNAEDIEKFKCKDGEIAMATAIAAVTVAVQNWLGDHTGYDCAADVIGKGDKNDIKSLLAVYNDSQYCLDQFVGMA